MEFYTRALGEMKCQNLELDRILAKWGQMTTQKLQNIIDLCLQIIFFLPKVNSHGNMIIFAGLLTIQSLNSISFLMIFNLSDIMVEFLKINRFI